MSAACPALPVAVTMGDPAGIGPDIIIAAWRIVRERGLPRFVVYGDPEVFAGRAAALGAELALLPLAAPVVSAPGAGPELPIISVGPAGPVVAGQPSAFSAGATLAAIDRATADVLAGRAAALVTAPITKAVLYAAGFRHPGHTEYLAHLATIARGGAAIRPVMMLACDELRVVPATIHIPLRDVPQVLTAELLEHTILATESALKQDFGLKAPRIAVCGLNPHAGEQGTIGREDRDLIAPVVAALAARGLRVAGPRPADTMFHAAARTQYDAAIAMYHDQALIPAKTLAFDRAVNVTLGLPFVRTSPDHGTAYDIAGSGQANPESFIAALKMAAGMAQSRASLG